MKTSTAVLNNYPDWSANSFLMTAKYPFGTGDKFIERKNLLSIKQINLSANPATNENLVQRMYGQRKGNKDDKN